VQIEVVLGEKLHALFGTAPATSTHFDGWFLFLILGSFGLHDRYRIGKEKQKKLRWHTRSIL
jgi:hypothetical protein